MGLDPYTTAVIVGVSLGVLGVLCLYFWIQDREASWLAWWAAVCLLGAMGVLLQIPRLAPVLFWPPEFSYAFPLSGFACAWQATRAFEGKRTSAWPPTMVAALWIAACFIPGLLEDPYGRVIATSIPEAGLLGLASRELWRNRDEALRSKRPAAMLLASLAAIFALRAPLAFVLPFPFGGRPVTSLALAVFSLIIFAHGGFLVALLISLSKERREAAQRTFAQSDPLTGLPNRRAFSEQAPRLLLRQAHARAPLALLVLDLDHFKQVNDRFGHSVGDRVLQRFAELLRMQLRVPDLSYRLGGEEFCCLLPDVSVKEAELIAERICASLSRTTFEVGRKKVRSTVSIGIASSQLDGYDLELLLAQADAAVYEAKARGRNMAVVKGGGPLGAVANLALGVAKPDFGTPASRPMRNADAG